MTKQIVHVLNTNLDFIQHKLYDFSDEKIDHEKIISERLNKNPKIENTNQKLFSVTLGMIKVAGFVIKFGLITLVNGV